MLSQTKQLCFCVTDVPHCYCSIHTPCHHQILIERRVVNTHYLSYVCLDALADLLLPSVPNLQFFIITNTCKLIGIKLVPCNILDYLRVRIPFN